MPKEFDISIACVIPARYSSTRLPGKPLADVAGKPLIQRVFESVSSSRLLNEIVIATDDKRIKKACEAFGSKAVLTRPNLASGTDRVWEAVKILNLPSEIIANVQGDEPLLKGEIIDKAIAAFIESEADVGTLVSPLKELKELYDPSVVKAKTDKLGFALDFERFPVAKVSPAKARDIFESGLYRKHIGFYVYRRESLEKFVSLPPSKREKENKLEQLRGLDAGFKYLCVETKADLIGVDTPADLEKARKLFSR